jgi:hypothetical protein
MTRGLDEKLKTKTTDAKKHAALERKHASKAHEGIPLVRAQRTHINLSSVRRKEEKETIEYRSGFTSFNGFFGYRSTLERIICRTTLKSIV